MKRPGNIFSVVLIVFFLSWISLPLLNNALMIFQEPETSKTENRNLARKPLFNIALLDPYPKRYEKYYNDHFLLRTQLLRVNALTDYFLFRKSPAPQDVAIGKEGWMYLTQKEKEVYTGAFMLNDYQVFRLVKELRDRTIQLKQMGIRFYVAFAPTKPDIYPEYLPDDFIYCRTGTVTEKIISQIKKYRDINFIELENPLIEAKKHARLFNKTDNHWNNIGGFVAYRELAKRICRDFPTMRVLTDSDIVFHDTISKPGNLAIMTNLTDYMKEQDFIPVIRDSKSKSGKKSGYKPLHYWEPTDNLEVVSETGENTRPKALVFRDSFTNAVMPFLDESFGKTVYIFDSWRYGFNRPIVENEKPDFVLLIIFEPHVANLLQNP
jgi:alginate O-acetyltransferase complex protein AlgJ